jgi:hypothetical protein
MAVTNEVRDEDQRLHLAGFDPAAAPEQAVATLRELRANPDVPEGAIARALGSIVAPAAAELLAAMETGATGPNRREIRRALFRLRQAGIEPVHKAVPQPATARASGADTGLEGVLSPIDATGVGLAWIVKARARGGLARLWGFVSETEGLIGCQLTNVSRRDLRRDRATVEERSGARLIDADWRVADRVLTEAYHRTPDDKRAAVGNFLALRAEIIETSPAADFVHPIYAELEAEAAAEPSIELIREPEIAAWQFSPAEIKPFVDEIADIRNSVIVLSPAHNEERIARVIETASARLLGGERAERTRRRLEDTAYYLARTGRQAAAGWAAGAARRLRDGVEPAKIAPLYELVRLAVGAEIANQTEKARDEPRLIMTPAEAMQARRTRGRP